MVYEGIEGVVIEKDERIDEMRRRGGSSLEGLWCSLR
jgi:hypothetical protein